MFAKSLSAAAVILAASSLVSGQTFTDCNPLQKTCKPDPAFGKNKVNCDFTKGACSALSELPGTTLKYDGKGAVFSISKDSEAPTVATGKFIFFGRLDVEVQAAAGKGIVTSVVLQSKDLDEIDWEWVGGDNAQVQTNYFSKGDTSTYDRGAYHPVSNPTGSFHTYSVEWTSKAVNWIVDGQTVRTLTYEQAKGGSAFPQTPMEIKLGTWVAGRKDAPEGTVQWAGGRADFSNGPSLGYYKSVKITDYAGGDGPTNKDVKEYVWTDKTGDWKSIKVVQGNGSSDDDDDDKTSTKPPTKTSTHASTHTSESDKSTKTATTLSTAVTTDASSTETDTPASTTGTQVTATPSNAPSTVPGNAGISNVASLGAALLAGAGVMAVQMFL